MYLPSHFEQHDSAALHALMRLHPLATLVTPSPDGPCADLLPLELQADDGPHGTLLGHVARANPLWRHAAGQPVLVIFNGPQAYVTPSAYPSKALTHKVVPTWNYSVVQARGVLQVEHEGPALHALVSRLTARHEATRERPWAVSDAPDDFVKALLRAIVGIRIPLQSLVGKFKLSQNRDEADRAGVVATLSEGDAAAQALAASMRMP